MTKFSFYLPLLLLLASGILRAQENKVLNADEEKSVTEKLRAKAERKDSTAWTNGATIGLNVTQTYLSNWAAGVQSSVATTALFSYFANYLKGKDSWDNTLDMAYGLLRQGDAGQWIKTDDRIDVASKYGREASKVWYYSGLLNFRSQFAPGFNIANGREIRTKNVDGEERDARISDFLSPGYMLVALGMDYRPSNTFSAFIAPVTLKTTFVMNQDLADAGAFGVDPAVYDASGVKLEDGANIRNELGGYIKFAVKADLMENVGLQTRLDLFSNYQNNPGNIDVNWEALISMKVNKYLSVSITTQLLYDDDIKIVKRPAQVDGSGNVTEPANIGPGTQFKEVMAIGFNYKF